MVVDGSRRYLMVIDGNADGNRQKRHVFSSRHEVSFILRITSQVQHVGGSDMGAVKPLSRNRGCAVAGGPR